MSNPVQYKIKGQAVDGELITPAMRIDLEKGYISIVFYSYPSFKIPSMPSAGTLSFSASEEEVNYGTIKNGAVDVTKQDYDRTNFAGVVKFIKCSALGIVGAGFYVATITKM